MPVDLDQTNIDPADPTYRPLLDDLQGNIIKGHGRDHSFHIFLQFKTGAEAAARDFIREFAATLPSATCELRHHYDFVTSRERVNKIPFRGLLLSATAYSFFGFPDRAVPLDPRFRMGMEDSAPRLGDSPAGWERAYRGRRIHAMIVLANDDAKLLRRERDSVAAKARKVAKVLAVQSGDALRRNKNDVFAVEHFGFADGVSQPQFLKNQSSTRPLEPALHYDPSAPLDLVLVRDPNGVTADSCGSYLVYRKIEQNVAAFRRCERLLVKELALKRSDEKRAGAMMLGRFENGTPLASNGEPLPSKKLSAINDFDYGGDAAGNACPFHAHVRKMNNRDDQHRQRRIARRGITYGRRRRDLSDSPHRGVGLLFMCFQAGIAAQFEWLQQLAANNRAFEVPGAGLDPLVGQGTSIPQSWPTQYGGPARQPLDIGGLTTVIGGEYFFAPSLGFLRAFPSARA